jgi:periplasmic divalent cation tolerance protein
MLILAFTTMWPTGKCPIFDVLNTTLAVAPRCSYHINRLMSNMSGEVSTVFVTYPDERIARTVCRSLIERRLAACSNIFAVGSIYRWEGKIEETSEFASLLKIRSEDFHAVAEAIKQLHPYEIPCIVRYDVADGSVDYMEWVMGSCCRTPEG